MHKDVGADAHQTQCKKAASLSQRAGAPSERELRLRLKRWLLTGLIDSEDWPADAMRRTHVGLQLADLADGPSEEDMDEWMQGFVASLTGLCRRARKKKVQRSRVQSQRMLVRDRAKS